MKSEKEIKVKINGETKTFTEGPPVHDWKAGSDEVAASEETQKETTNEHKIYYFPQKNVKRKNPRLHRSTVKQPSGFRIWKLVGPMLTAVLIGVLLGVIILQMIKQDKNEPTSALVDVTNTSKEANEGATEVLTPSTLPGFNLHVVQGGYFSQQDSATTQLASFKDKNIPSEVLTINNEYYIWTGLASTKESADKLETSYKELGVDVFDKSIGIPAKDITLSEGDAQTVGKVATVFPEMVKTYSSFQSTGKAEVTVFKDQIASISGAATANENVKKLQAAVSEAYQSLETYVSGEGNESDVQQKMLTVLKEYLLVN
ncbi:hypothetical protein Q75_10830 [Bacillus coahuilensis p1.1.43]|uniref:SPOR domain-containing protein n=2 Tax=Bacillus coahuilensis TaxID=408580 RepID=A0A147K799_9BACI|nr:hypothetical protein [Bacillus coahuilensis]KUP05871.1 hypothetical protein Q75_10830 [Bacillus coahuilensis p1.1.43]